MQTAWEEDCLSNCLVLHKLYFICFIKDVNGRGIGTIYSLSLRETFKIFHRGGVAVAHVLKKIEQMKLNDQCQGIAEI